MVFLMEAYACILFILWHTSLLGLPGSPIDENCTVDHYFQ